MSELQDDLSLFTGDVAPDPGSPLANIVEAARQWADLMDDVREAVKGKTGNAILMTANEIGKHLGVTEDGEDGT